MSSAQLLVIILCWDIERYPAVQCCCKSPFSFSAEQIKRKEDWKDEIERFLYILKKNLPVFIKLRDKRMNKIKEIQNRVML